MEQPVMDPKRLLYGDSVSSGTGAPEALSAYYARAGQGEDRQVSRSVWEAAQMVPARARRLLDIGCHVGYLGQLVKARRQIEVVGIELDRAAAAQARAHLDQVLEHDIERSDALPFPEGSFDCITLLDVLEHLILPEKALATLRRYLSPKGRLILSVPNVRHVSVLASLLLPGRRWTIEGQGMVTDPAHLRFFTLEDLLVLLRGTGFSIESPLTVTCTDASLPFMRELLDHLRGMASLPEVHLQRLRLELSTFQFVFAAARGDARPPATDLEIRSVPNSLHPLRELLANARRSAA